MKGEGLFLLITWFGVGAGLEVCRSDRPGQHWGTHAPFDLVLLSIIFSGAFLCAFWCIFG